MDKNRTLSKLLALRTDRKILFVGFLLGGGLCIVGGIDDAIHAKELSGLYANYDKALKNCNASQPGKTDAEVFGPSSNPIEQALPQPSGNAPASKDLLATAPVQGQVYEENLTKCSPYSIGGPDQNKLYESNQQLQKTRQL